MYLNQNELTGPIPPELGQLINLKWLFLDENELTGPIPWELSQLTRLSKLGLDQDKLGCIPGALAWLLDGTVCPSEPNLCENGIAVPNPQDNPGLVKDCEVLLAILDTLGGRLNWSGNVPMTQWKAIELGNSGVTTLAIWHGRLSLTGSIPSGLGQLTELESMAFDGTQLTGPIPRELGQLKKLEWLDLSRNQLTGSIPRELGQLTKLERLDLSGNQLTDPIPRELGQLTNFQVLNLHYNQLEDPIPPELGKLINLERLLLYNNKLAGCVPVLATVDRGGPIYGRSSDPPTCDATAVEGTGLGILPISSGLDPNFPNPFNARTQIPYRLATPGPVRLVVYNLLGQPVRTLVDQVQTAGSYQVHWDARDQRGVAVSAGIYLTRLRYPGGVQTRHLLYLK